MKLAALAATLLMAGCGAAVPTYPTAPPLPAERIPLPPVSEAPLIWHPGDWVYVGGSYRYEAGRYEPAGNHSTIWVPGHWTGSRRDYAWIPGAWQ